MRHSARRGDVQGLRAIAVLLVIGVHSVGLPRGGFAGVDIFFVISGFVITLGLLREAEATGRISLRRFYARRMQRIAPAALVTLLLTALAAAALLPASRAASVAKDAGWAAIGAENVWLTASGAAQSATTSSDVPPLAHFWSLAVEEQFYLVWPLLLLLAWRVGVRRGAPQRWVIGIAATASIASLALGAWVSMTDARAAYFSTLARGWELGAGCLLAVLAPRLERMPRKARLALAFGGLIALEIGCVVWTQESFPVPAALFPVAGAVAVLAAGTGGEPVAITTVLQHPALRRVGDLSYSLYLWHMPVFVLMVVAQPRAGWDVLAESLSLTALLAWLSWRFIERPVLRRFSSGSALVEGSPASGRSAHPARGPLRRHPLPDVTAPLAAAQTAERSGRPGAHLA